MAETAKALTTLEIGEAGGAFQIPVTLKKISTSSDVELDSASPDGNILKQLYVDSKTLKPVKKDEMQKGVFRVKPTKSKKETWSGFQAISKDDLAIIEDATNLESFVVEHFIPLKDVPFERVTDAYYLAPIPGMTAKSLVLFARALKRAKRAGVFKLVKSKRQYLAVVYEKHGGLIVNTLAFAGDFAAVREAGEALDTSGVKIKAGELDLAVQLVETLTEDPAVLDSYEDDLIPLKADLVERALAGKELPKRAKQKEPEIEPGDGLEEKLRLTLAKTSSNKGKAPSLA